MVVKLPWRFSSHTNTIITHAKLSISHHITGDAINMYGVSGETLVHSCMYVHIHIETVEIKA